MLPDWLRQVTWFWPSLMALTLTFGGGLWLAVDRRNLWRRREAEISRLAGEFRELEGFRPSATPETVAAVEGDEARLKRVLERWREVMGTMKSPDGIPTTRTEAYFDLAAFRLRLRRRAADLGVVLREGESFGFAAYVNEGPAEKDIPEIYRQRCLVEKLLQALLSTPPLELISVERERPGGGEDGPASKPDTFVINPRLTARRSGLIHAIAFRITFTARTPTLQDFLHRLGSEDSPFLVREITVEPAGGETLRRAKSGRFVPAQGPAAGVDGSRFTITLEWVEPIASASESDRDRRTVPL